MLTTIRTRSITLIVIHSDGGAELQYTTDYTVDGNDFLKDSKIPLTNCDTEISSILVKANNTLSALP